MTLNLLTPERKPDLGDRILRLMGKKRKLLVPDKKIDDAYAKAGPYVYLQIVAKRESFLSALLRRRDEDDMTEAE